jgi:hypothetical protein
MGLIEDQRLAVETEIKQARQSARRAEQAAESQRAIYEWSKANPSLSCEANIHLLVGYLSEAGILVSKDSLDLAKNACLRNLGVRAPEAPELTPEQKIQAENQRLKTLSPQELREEIRSGIKRKLASPEYGGYGSVYTPPFTVAEFLKMSASQVKELLHYPGSNQERPSVRAGIDKLLRDAQLLKEVTN